MGSKNASSVLPSRVITEMKFFAYLLISSEVDGFERFDILLVDVDLLAQPGHVVDGPLGRHVRSGLLPLFLLEEVSHLGDVS